MYIIIKFCILLFVCSKHAKSDTCQGMHINNIFYRKEILAKNIDRPYQLSYDKYRHRLYFSYNVGEDEEDRFNIGYIEKGELQHKVKENVENGFAIAIDNANHKIYFGGSLGIYEESLKEGNKTKKIVEGFNIWDMFFKDELHFINYPQQRLYKYVDGKSDIKAIRQKHIHEKIYQYAVDSNEDTFITNKTGLYIIRNNTSERVLLKGANNFRCIEVNNKGSAHFCGQHAIYIANKSNHTLEKIVEVKNIFGLTFDDDDNIIYSDPHEIVKLLPGNCK